MVHYLNLISVLFAFATLAFGASLLWQIRGGLFAKAFTPIVAAWFFAAMIALLELLDTTPRGEQYSDLLRFFRLLLSFLGAFFLWRILHHSSVKMRVQ